MALILHVPSEPGSIESIIESYPTREEEQNTILGGSTNESFIIHSSIRISPVLLSDNV